MLTITNAKKEGAMKIRFCFYCFAMSPRTSEAFSVLFPGSPKVPVYLPSLPVSMYSWQNINVPSLTDINSPSKTFLHATVKLTSPAVLVHEHSACNLRR